MYKTIMNVHSRVIYNNPKAGNYPNAKQLQMEQMKIFNNKKLTKNKKKKTKMTIATDKNMNTSHTHK